MSATRLDPTALGDIAEQVWNDLIGSLPPTIPHHVAQRLAVIVVELDVVAEDGELFTLTVVCPEAMAIRLGEAMFNREGRDLSSEQLLDAAGEYGNLLAASVKARIVPDGVIGAPTSRRRASAPDLDVDAAGDRQVGGFELDHHRVRLRVSGLSGSTQQQPVEASTGEGSDGR